MNSVVEQKLGGRTLSFFLQGAPGDINPYYAVTPIEEGAVKWRDWTGERLGNEAARVAAEIHPKNSVDASIEFIEESLRLRLRWDPEKFRQALVRFLGPKFMDDYGAEIKSDFRPAHHNCAHQ